MANIILKDGNGNEITYNAVKNIKVKNSRGSESYFTDMTTLNLYVATYNSSTKKYTIKERNPFLLSGVGYVYCAAGNDSTYYYIFTTKSLTIGSSYLVSELGGV